MKMDQFSTAELAEELNRRLDNEPQAITLGGGGILGGGGAGGGVLGGALSKLLEKLLANVDFNAIIKSLLAKWLGGVGIPTP